MSNARTAGRIFWLSTALALPATAMFIHRAAAQADAAPAAATAVVQGVDFKYASGTSKLELTFDKDVTVEKTKSDADKQIILEIKGAKIGKKFARKLDTSSFKTNVTLISPYQSGDAVRIVLQLRQMDDVNVSGSGSKIVAMIDNKQGATAENADPAPPAATAAADAPKAEEPKLEAEPAKTASAPKADDKNADGNLEEFMRSTESHQYTGKKITLQLREADIKDVFQAVSEASEFNIVVADEVKGKVTMNLVQVPWDQVLDIILKSNKLGAERSGNVLRIATLDSMTKEKEAELANIKAVEAIEPLVVKIFPVSYAKIDELKKILDDFLSKETPSQGAAGPVAAPGAPGVKRGSIQIDSRTNALVVRDTPTTIEKIKRIIKELDTQTPQILIEAKFVEVSEQKNKALQGRIFSSSREFDTASSSMVFKNKNSNFGAAFGGSALSGSTGLPSAFSITPLPGASFGFSPQSGILPGISDEFSAFLGILESESNAKIIASPRVISQNKETAEITQGKAIQLATAGGANVAGGFQTINAVLKLTVTPQVTGDGSINLKLNFSQDSPSDTNVSGATLTTNTKKVDTTVLVDSGATLVIGGIYTSTVTEGKSGIPFLRDLPLIGTFFGSTTNSSEKGELFIFITPRILNEKEAGIQG